MAALALVVIVSAPGKGMPAAPLRRVLILDSFGREFAPYTPLIGSLKTELAQRVDHPIDYYEVPIEMARFSESHAEEALVDYTRALFADRQLDLLVPVGGAALRFWERHRAELFPSTPTLITGLDQRHVQDLHLTANQTAVCVRLDIFGAIEDVLRLLPGTTNIAVVFGHSPLEVFWIEEARREWQPLAARVQFTWWNDLPLDEMRRRAAELRPGSAIFYFMMSVDANGVPYEGDQALAILHAEAGVPIFGLFASQLGKGIVGGRLLDPIEAGRAAADVASRVLAGEEAGSIRAPLIEPATPRYDWLELERWHIDVRSLPPGSIVLHQTPSMWERYRWRILLGLGIICFQALVLAGLLVQRARRRRAELESLERRRELLHATRLSTLGELTASLAHELHQPLGAILRNAEAAEILMQRTPPDLDELRAILADIRQDDTRAARVIDHLRSLLKRRELESSGLAVGDLFGEVRSLLRGDAVARGVRLVMEAPSDLPAVKGDRVHLVQALLNLVVNAMDASMDAPENMCEVTVRAIHDNGLVEVAVTDTGRGIPADHLERIFQPFHTTKTNGLGLGLSIARTIVEAHGGRIWVRNNPQRGATFGFTLPVEAAGVRA